jgi:hypothetical protein
MLKEFLDRILEVTQAKAFTLNGGVTYADKKLSPVAPLKPEPLRAYSLTGLIDYYKSVLASDTLGWISEAEKSEADILSLFSGSAIAHIVSHREVHLLSALHPIHRHREALLIAKTVDVAGFAFDRWLDLEEFVIGVQANFRASTERDLLLRTVSKITTAKGATMEDDGVSQTVSVKKGVALQEMQKLPNPVTLHPLRGFTEIDPPVASQFVLRVRQRSEGDPVQVALFEADGAAWQLEARIQIRDWLRANIPDLPVIS